MIHYQRCELCDKRRTNNSVVVATDIAGIVFIICIIGLLLILAYSQSGVVIV